MNRKFVAWLIACAPPAYSLMFDAPLVCGLADRGVDSLGDQDFWRLPNGSLT
jgi:hypothetical protein